MIREKKMVCAHMGGREAPQTYRGVHLIAVRWTGLFSKTSANPRPGGGHASPPPSESYLLGKHERRANGMVRCVLRISPVGLARAPDLLGVNLDTDREDFDLLDMPHPVGAISPFSVSGPFPFSREERTSSKNTNCKISGPPRQPVAVACKLAYVKLAFIFSPQ